MQHSSQKTAAMEATQSKDHTGNTASKGENDTLYKGGDPKNPHPIGWHIYLSSPYMGVSPPLGYILPCITWPLKYHKTTEQNSLLAVMFCAIQSGWGMV